MDVFLKVLIVDALNGFYRVKRYPLGDFFGPVDLGLHLSGRLNSLNIATGLLAGSIFPGSNRLVFTGFSPCWGGFFISSMGGAGLVFDNLGINMLSIVNRSSSPSVLYLNRVHGEEIQVEIQPLDISQAWNQVSLRSKILDRRNLWRELRHLGRFHAFLQLYQYVYGGKRTAGYS